ncbi:MAG: HlyC/CorC family transporter [Phycisphaerales bacterium]|nr:HlyC/CorC family transporter [Phycisphaerales bacterium]
MARHKEGWRRRVLTFLLGNLDLLIPIVLLLAVAAIFACSETALFSLSRHDLHLFESRGKPSEALAARLRRQSRPLLVTILLANMLANILIFVLSTLLLDRIYHAYGRIAVALLAIAPVVLTAYFGEIMPKLIGRLYNRRLAPLLARPLSRMMDVMEPVVRLINFVMITPVHRLLDRPLGSERFSVDDLRLLLSMSQHHGIIDFSENELLQQVVRLREIRIRDLMTPRVDMPAFDVARSMAELRSMLLEKRLTRLPVFDRQIDSVLGVLHAKTYFLERPTTTTELKPLLQPADFVPQMQTLDRLLTHFRKAHRQMAIVVDEFGGVAGSISLEDVVEHLIGDIAEPDEPVMRLIEQVGPDQWRVSGNLSLLEWVDMFGTAAKQTRASTVAGLIYAVLKRLPQVGDVVTIGHLQMRVEAMAGPRVRQVLIKLIDEEPR